MTTDSPYQPKHFNLTHSRFDGDPEHDLPPYLFPESAVIALDVALATGRPLLVAGPPGCGKSRLAEAIAAVLGWNFLSRTMTSRTRIDELTVEVDQLRRLHDAQCAAIPRPASQRRKAAAPPLPPDEAYYSPGIFWWAFDRGSAARRGLAAKHSAACGVDLTYPGAQRVPPEEEKQHTVLLIDEIDKAEPDLPNDLLEPLDRRSFPLPNEKKVFAVPGQKLLTVITTNKERELPQAFLRRCVTLLLEHPDAGELVRIADAHRPQANEDLVKELAKMVVELRKQAAEKGRRQPGTSEFLDALIACEDLQIGVDHDLWEHIRDAVLLKPTALSDRDTVKGA